MQTGTAKSTEDEAKHATPLKRRPRGKSFSHAPRMAMVCEDLPDSQASAAGDVRLGCGEEQAANLDVDLGEASAAGDVRLGCGEEQENTGRQRRASWSIGFTEPPEADSGTCTASIDLRNLRGVKDEKLMWKMEVLYSQEQPVPLKEDSRGGSTVTFEDEAHDSSGGESESPTKAETADGEKSSDGKRGSRAASPRCSLHRTRPRKRHSLHSGSTKKSEEGEAGSPTRRTSPRRTRTLQEGETDSPTRRASPRRSRRGTHSTRGTGSETLEPGAGSETLEPGTHGAGSETPEQGRRGHRTSHCSTISGDPNMERRHSRAKSCEKCSACFVGYGTSCGACRKLTKGGTVQQCSGCQVFFAGYGAVCPDCHQ